MNHFFGSNGITFGIEVRNVSLARYFSSMETIEHQGDFTCVEDGAFRTFYMTCSCGWSKPLKLNVIGLSSYFLNNIWLEHLE